jgi:membrane protease YdiL (CAAX protease family)
VPNLLQVGLFLGLTISLLFAVEFVAAFVSRQPLARMVADEKLQLMLTALVYVLTLLAAGVLFPALWTRSFWVGIGWNARRASPWLGLFGLVMGFVAEAISYRLPTPREMPIEDVFKTPGIIWLLVVFGTVLAPLFEEVVFRGLLLPAIANAVDWVRLPREAAALEQWRQSEGFSRGAMVVASLLTSVLFAGIHAPQLGFNWAPVALLVCVSVVLCVVRLRIGSVAASTLVHGCYNLAAFVLIFVATGGFRHMEQQ